MMGQSRPAANDLNRRAEEVSIQVATRLPRGLFRVVKLHCAKIDMPLREFFEEALREKLARTRR